MNSEEAAWRHSETEDVSQQTVLSDLWPRKSHVIMSDVIELNDAFLDLKPKNEVLGSYYEFILN